MFLSSITTGTVKKTNFATYNFGTTKIVQNHYKTMVRIPTILPLGVTYVEPPQNKESTRSLELAAQAAKSNNKLRSSVCSSTFIFAILAQD